MMPVGPGLQWLVIDHWHASEPQATEAAGAIRETTSNLKPQAAEAGVGGREPLQTQRTSQIFY
jgi:hypothetical protein